MKSHHISEWLESQGAEICGALAGMVSFPVGNSGSTEEIGWPEQAAGLTGFQLVNSRVIESRSPCIKQVNTEAADEYAAIVGVPVETEKNNPVVTAFLVKGDDPSIGETALAQLREAVPSLQYAIDLEQPENILESPRRIELNQQTAAQTADTAHIERLGAITRLIATTLSTHKFRQMALTLTTELAIELDCERVILGMRRGRKTRLEAISHTANIKRSTPIVAASIKAMDEALDQHSTIIFPPLEDDSLMLSRLNHEALSDISKQDQICTLPLLHETEVVGALLLERTAERGFSPQDRELFEHIASFLAPVLQMKFRLGQPWYKRFLLSIANIGSVLQKREGILWTLGLTALTAATVALSIIPLPHAVTANARVEGSVQRQLSAPQAGFIEAVHVRPGDSVNSGDVLLSLEDKDLMLERDQARSEYRQLETTYGKALALSDRTEVAVVQAKMSEAKARLELVAQKLSRTQLSAPFDGIVLEGDLTQSLGAPVDKGQQLMVLAPDLDIHVALHVDETEIRNVSIGQSGKVAFTANPGKQHAIHVMRITPVASVEEGNNGFTVEASLENHDSSGIRPGYQGVAKLALEEQPLLPRLLDDTKKWIFFHLWRWTGEL